MVGLSDDELDFVRKIVRARQAFSILGMNSREQLILLSMLADNRPWSALSMAEWTGFSRASVRETFQDWQRMGIVEHIKDGWVYTDHGRELMLEVWRETWGHAERKRHGYSDNLLGRLAVLPKHRVRRPFRTART